MVFTAPLLALLLVLAQVLAQDQSADFLVISLSLDRGMWLLALAVV